MRVFSCNSESLVLDLKRRCLLGARPKIGSEAQKLRFWRRRGSGGERSGGGEGAAHMQLAIH